MEHHLSKLTTSSLVSDYVGTLASAGITTDCIDAVSYGTLSGQSHSVYSDRIAGINTFRDTMVDDILATEFYGVPADVIRSLIREHLPEYVL